MNKILKRILPMVLTIAIAATCIPSISYAEESLSASLADVETGVSTVSTKTNLNFIEGSPGDEYVVYTYMQNNLSYKVVEHASDDFKNVSSVIYVADDNGRYTKSETQKLETAEGEVPQVTIERESGLIEVYEVDCQTTTNCELNGVMPLSDYEWVTEYYSGKSSSIKGLTITVIIGVITGIASYYCAGPVASGTVSGVSAIASYYFQEDSEYAYYYTIYNWRHSSKSYFVIEETEWTDFYLDSAHKYKVGHTYYEWLDE